ncbi:hypothetical protein IM40_00460 [Candidatus Paracaedimonas acanthamoebae]|nr:hypothetical protein IM40_00460 [Candidatus Paracaedimonas acanthamoebae]
MRINILAVSTVIYRYFVFLLIFLSSFFSNFTISHASLVDLVLRENAECHKTMKKGMGYDHPVSTEEMKAYPGHCGNFCIVLRDALQSKNIISTLINVYTSDSAKHTIIETCVTEDENPSKYTVCDPFLGIAYKHSFIELLNNPGLAEEYVGEKPTAQYYYGPIFFKGVTVCEYSLESIYVNKFVNHSYACYNKFPQTIENFPNDCLFIKIKPSLPISILVDKYSFNLREGKDYVIPVTALQNKSLTITDTNEVNIVHLYEVWSMDTFRTKFSPPPSLGIVPNYLRFTGEPIDIFSIGFCLGAERILTINMGDAKSEKQRGIRVFSPEDDAQEKKTNSWSFVKTLEKLSYRTACENTESLYKHSAIQFRLLQEYANKSLRLFIYYRLSQGKSTVSLFNVPKGQYQSLGEMPISQDKTSISFDINKDLVFF